MSNSLAIIELYQHDEVLRHYCDMLIDSDYNIKVFCSKIVYKNLYDDFSGKKQFEFFVKEENCSIPAFLKSHKTNIQPSELIFITTALNHFKAFHTLLKGAKTLLLIHNAHSFLAPEKYLDFRFPVTDRLRWLKSKLHRSGYYKSKILQTVSGLVFPSKTVLEYVKSTFGLPKSLKLLSLPFAYFGEKERTKTDILTITIPCTVNDQIRDYKSVLDAIHLLKNQLKQRVRIVLLGQARTEGKYILERFHSIRHPLIEIVSFAGFIPPDEYQKWLYSSDFLVLPLKEHVRNQIYRERMGYSKISGGINDMIRSGIPALIPQYYPLETPLKPLTAPYEKDQLADHLEAWISEKSFSERYKNRGQALSSYRREDLRAQFLKALELMIAS